MNQITLNLKVDDLIRQALQEDINSEDVSTNSVLREKTLGQVELLAKEKGIIAGLDVFSRTFELLDRDTEIEFKVQDGDLIQPGEKLALLKGDLRVLLSGERVALNFLQRMSGIATYTYNMVKYLKGTKTKLVDTRKTTPLLRVLEKYAVSVGGGENHRFNLSDGIMLKDNHIGAAGGIKEAVALAKDYGSFMYKIEVEVETLDGVREAVEAGADVIMLDNMDYSTMKEAIEIIDGRALTECSGNVDQENIEELASLGVDIISSGALTHSAPILDLSMKNMRPL